MAIDLPDVYIEMMEGSTTDDYETTEEPIPITYTVLNTNDYDGTAQYYFEIICENGDTPYEDPDNYPHDFKLVDTDDNVYATITVPPNWSAVWEDYNFEPWRYRSAAFTPASGSKTYAVQMETALWGGGMQRLYAARIIVRQSAATKTRTQYPLMSFWGTGFSGENFRAKASYTNENKETNLWQYNASDQTTIASITLSAWGYCTSTVAFKVALFDVDDNEMVANSELTIPQAAGDWIYKEGTATFNTSDLTDGHKYEYRAMHNENTNAYLYKCHLYFTLTSISQIAVWYRVGKSSQQEYWSMEAPDFSAVDSTDRVCLRLQAGVTAYFEVTAIKTVTGDRDIKLRDDNGNDYLWAGTNLDASALTFTSLTRTYQRTADIASVLVDDRRYTLWWEYNPSDSDETCPIGSFIVIIKSAAVPYHDFWPWLIRYIADDCQRR